MEPRQYIAYYRVSTDRQGRSGLGLEAQQQAVHSFLQARGELIASFMEVESGKRNDRPEIVAALAACRKHKAMLVIAKLDRLARNVHFISGLMESGVEFVAVDMPEVSRLTVLRHGVSPARLRTVRLCALVCYERRQSVLQAKCSQLLKYCNLRVLSATKV